MPVNVWSAGEYLQNLTGFIHPTNTNTSFVEVTTDYETIGNNCLKVVRKEAENFFFNVQYKYTPQASDLGKTATFKVDVNNQLSDSARLYGVPTNYVSIPQGSTANASVSGTIEDISNDIVFSVAFPGSVYGTLYLDNFRLTIQ